jgi:hypothetical protein
MDPHQLLEGEPVAGLGFRDQLSLVDAQRSGVDVQTIEIVAARGWIRRCPALAEGEKRLTRACRLDHRSAKNGSTSVPHLVREPRALAPRAGAGSLHRSLEGGVQW